MMRICTFEEVDPNPLLLLIHRCQSLFPQTFRRPQPKIPAIAQLASALDPIMNCAVVWNALVFLTEDAQVNLTAINLKT